MVHKCIMVKISREQKSVNEAKIFQSLIDANAILITLTDCRSLCVLVTSINEGVVALVSKRVSVTK